MKFVAGADFITQLADAPMGGLMEVHFIYADDYLSMPNQAALDASADLLRGVGVDVVSIGFGVSQVPPLTGNRTVKIRFKANSNSAEELAKFAQSGVLGWILYEVQWYERTETKVAVAAGVVGAAFLLLRRR